MGSGGGVDDSEDVFGGLSYDPTGFENGTWCY